MNENSNISFIQDKIVLYKLFVYTCQFVLLALSHLPPQPNFPSPVKDIGEGVICTEADSRVYLKP